MASLRVWFYMSSRRRSPETSYYPLSRDISPVLLHPPFSQQSHLEVVVHCYTPWSLYSTIPPQVIFLFGSYRILKSPPPQYNLNFLSPTSLSTLQPLTTYSCTTQ